MGNEKFVIWGIGERGKIITEFLEDSQILAYIDTDISKQGMDYLNHPIISFEEYLEKFQNYFIIVTPVEEEPILNLLYSYGIDKYFQMSHLPSEMQGYGDRKFLDQIQIPLTESGNNIIVGTTLYSCILYREIEAMGYKNVFLLKKAGDKMANLIQKNYQYNTITQIDKKNDRIIVTTAIKENNEGETVFDFFDISEYLPQYYNKDIEKFHNIHNGKRCFIVATGPSLRQDDLRILSENKEICFGVNRVFYVDEKLWKPQYYLFLDRAGMKQYWDLIAAYNVKEKFVGDSYWRSIDYKGNMHVIHALTGHSFDISPKFSERIERKVYAYATVTYAAIQMAVYMGFSTIYLLGVDCSYNKNNKENYFFQEQKKDVHNHYEDRMLVAYRTAKEYADTHDIRILNASRGGSLEVFDRIDFDKIFI